MRCQSFSSINTYYTCPRQYKLTYVTPVIPYQETDATRWGTEVHLALEEFCRDGKPLPENCQDYAKYGEKLKSLPGEKFYEIQCAVDASFKPVDFDDKSAVLRGIIDVLVVNGSVALVNDWKTGKVKPDSDQLKLFAGFVMAKFPEVNTVKTVYAWLAHKQTTVETYTRDDLPSIWQHFLAKLSKIKASYETDRWVPKTSGLCNGWCGAGTNCDFWRPKRTNR